MALDLPSQAGSDGLHFSTNERSSTYAGDSLDDATGAGAVVIEDVPDRTVVVGVPASVLKTVES